MKSEGFDKNEKIKNKTSIRARFKNAQKQFNHLKY